MLAAARLPKTETVSASPVTTIYELARSSAAVRGKVLEKLEHGPLRAESVKELISDAQLEERALASNAEEKKRHKRNIEGRRRREVNHRAMDRLMNVWRSTPSRVQDQFLARVLRKRAVGRHKCPGSEW